MARPLRIEVAGMWYHIINRGNLRKDIYESDNDYLRFLEVLNESCEKYNVEMHSYVLMPNHFHFFLKTNEANLSRFMHRQLTSYTTWFNQKYDRVGHLFQGRYKSIVVDSNSYGREITRYIHLNPVRTKKNSKLSLREKRKILRNYKWSSYPAMIDIKPSPSFLFVNETLESFGENYIDQIKNYIHFIEEGIKNDLDNPLKNAVAQSILGSKTFVREVRKQLTTSNKAIKKHDIESNSNIRFLISQPIEKIFDVVCKEYDIDIQSILKNGKWRRNIEPRQVAFYLAEKYCVGIMTLNKISKLMGCVRGNSVSMAAKRIKKLMGKDKTLMNKLRRLEKELGG